MFTKVSPAHKNHIRGSKVKQCPRCSMTVDDDTECPFCHETLTFEPSVPADKEHIVYNKYYWIYKLKTMWFSLACLIFCAVRLLTAEQYWYPNMLLCWLVCFGVSLAQRPLTRALQYYLQEDRAAFTTEITKYIFGALAIFISLFAV